MVVKGERKGPSFSRARRRLGLKSSWTFVRLLLLLLSFELAAIFVGVEVFLAIGIMDLFGGIQYQDLTLFNLIFSNRLLAQDCLLVSASLLLVGMHVYLLFRHLTYIVARGLIVPNYRSLSLKLGLGKEEEEEVLRQFSSGATSRADAIKHFIALYRFYESREKFYESLVWRIGQIFIAASFSLAAYILGSAASKGQLPGLLGYMGILLSFFLYLIFLVIYYRFRIAIRLMREMLRVVERKLASLYAYVYPGTELGLVLDRAGISVLLDIDRIKTLLLGKSEGTESDVPYVQLFPLMVIFALMYAVLVAAVALIQLLSWFRPEQLLGQCLF